jgi:predicted CoA-binding protein
MLEHGYTVIPVNPGYDSILGQKCYKSLRDIPTRVDIVDCFRKTEDIMPIVDDAIAIGAKVLWQQLGVKNAEAARRAEAGGMEAVMDRCVKIEHARLFGGLNWAGVNTKVISAVLQWLPTEMPDRFPPRRWWTMGSLRLDAYSPRRRARPGGLRRQGRDSRCSPCGCYRCSPGFHHLGALYYTLVVSDATLGSRPRGFWAG